MSEVRLEHLNSSRKLEDEFSLDIEFIRQHEKEIGCHSGYLWRMIEDIGALSAAHKMLKPEREFPSGTFSYPRKCGRPDLIMEHYVIQDKYRPLFSETEREIAAFRLRAGD
jgi:hypothetical protein